MKFRFSRQALWGTNYKLIVSESVVSTENTFVDWLAFTLNACVTLWTTLGQTVSETPKFFAVLMSAALKPNAATTAMVRWVEESCKVVSGNRAANFCATKMYWSVTCGDVTLSHHTGRLRHKIGRSGGIQCRLKCKPLKSRGEWNSTRSVTS